MAPEQIEGVEADARTDIFAFGCVLFEMLTGKKAFEGKTRASLIGAIMHAEPPPVSQVQPVAPAALNHIVARCLAKDPDDRWQSARDLMHELKWVADGGVSLDSAAQTTSPAPRSAWSRALTWTAAAAALVFAIAWLAVWAPWRAAAPPRVTRMTITPFGPAALTINRTDGDLALTPDGTHVVYIGNNGTQLFVRALDALEPVAIASGGGGGVRGPFVSPDSQWVGFDEGNNILKKVAITGGPSITLAVIDAGSRGATWAPDDTIIFATNNPTTGLQRVSAAGGTPEVLTRPDHAQGEADHLWPEILPGGRAVLFTITSQTGGLDTAQVAVRDLRTGTQKVLLRGGSHGHYVASGLASPKRGEGGHLVYVAAGTLRAIPFDPNRLETHGTAVPVLPRLVVARTGAGDFAVAADGTLVYVDVPGSLGGPNGANGRTLVWVDRTGKEAPIAAPPRAYEHPRLSPNGTRLALSSFDQENDIWIWDLGRATLTRLTLDPGQDQFPLVDTRRPADHLQLEPRRPAQSLVAGGRRHRRRRAADDEQPCPVSHRDHAGWDRSRVQRTDADDGPRSAATRPRRDTPRDATAADEVRRAQRDRLARRPVAGVRVQQLRLVRNLRPALSERRRRPVASLDRGG